MNKTLKNILKVVVAGVVIVGLILPLAIMAQENGGGPAGNRPAGQGGDVNFKFEIKNPLKGGVNSVDGFIRLIINDIVLPIGAVIAVVMIIYAGFMYVTAGGDPTKIQKAHAALLWGVIGAAILLGAWVIAEAIEGTIDQIKS